MDQVQEDNEEEIIVEYDGLEDDDDGLGGQTLTWREDVWAKAVPIPGQKRGSLLFIDEDTSYVYRRKCRESEYGRTYMVCRHDYCSSIAKMRRELDENDETVYYISQSRAHIHKPEPDFLEAKQFRIKLYDRARNECTALAEIHRQELAKIDNEFVIASMSYARLQSAMQRNRNIVFPPLPKSLAEFCQSLEDPQYSERFGKTRDGKPYFRTWRSGIPSEGTIAIFVSGHFEHMLSTSECFQINGHFKMSPNIRDVYQQVTIMPISYDYVFPAVTILMTRKTKAAYKMAFQCLKELVPTMRMPHVMSDFEKGLLGALREEFPDAHLTGCLFHLDQAMCKKAAKLGLRPLLNANQSAAKVVRMCMALPFLPGEKIVEGFEAVRNHSHQEHHVELEPFLDYVQKTWLEGVGPEHITVYRHHRRTNNDMESYHRTLTDTLGRPHPSPWCWLEALRDHEAHHLRRFIGASYGYSISRSRKKKYRLLDRNIRELSKKVHRMPVLQFLGAASYHCMETYERVVIREVEEVHAEDVLDDAAPPPPATVPLLAVEPEDPEDMDDVPLPTGPAERGRGVAGGGGRGERNRGRGDVPTEVAERGRHNPGGGRRGGGGRGGRGRGRGDPPTEVAEDGHRVPGDGGRGRGRGDPPTAVAEDGHRVPDDGGRGRGRGRGRGAGRGADGRVGNPADRGAPRGGATGVRRAVIPQAPAPPTTGNQDEFGAAEADPQPAQGAVRRPRRRATAPAEAPVGRVTRQTPVQAAQREERRVLRESRARRDERRSNEDIQAFMDQYNEHVERQLDAEELDRFNQEEGAAVLRDVPIHDPEQVTAEQFEASAAIVRREPDRPEPGNWRVVKLFRDLSWRDALTQASELAALVSMLPTLAPDTEANEGPTCLICQTNVPTRRCFPCLDVVYCTACMKEQFRQYNATAATGTPSTHKCPRCQCVIGFLQ